MSNDRSVILAAPHALAPLVALVLILTAALPLLAQAQRYVVRGHDVAIYNLAGEATLEPGTGPDVVVLLTRRGADAERLRVVGGQIRDRETLRVLYPDDQVLYPELRRSSRTQLAVRDDGTFGDGAGGLRLLRGDRVTISGSGRGVEAWADMRIQVPAGQRVAVYWGAGKASADNIDGHLRLDVASAAVSTRGTRGSLVVDVGSGAVSVSDAQGSVVIDTGSGAVSISGVDADDVLIDTGSGRVDIGNVRGRSVRIDTGSGQVEASGIHAQRLEVDTGSGSVDLEAVTATNVRLDTGSGGIRIDLRSDIDSLVIDTGSGGVTLNVPANFGAAIEVDTGSGGIDVTGVPLYVQERRRAYLRGAIGDGKGVVRIETGSGGVRIVGAS